MLRFATIFALTFTALLITAREPMKIRPKQCSNAAGENGTCMFVWECIKTEGRHLGTCVDGFLFGSCCGHLDGENTIDEFNRHRPSPPTASLISNAGSSRPIYTTTTRRPPTTTTRKPTTTPARRTTSTTTTTPVPTTIYRRRPTTTTTTTTTSTASTPTTVRPQRPQIITASSGSQYQFKPSAHGTKPWNPYPIVTITKPHHKPSSYPVVPLQGFSTPRPTGFNPTLNNWGAGNNFGQGSKHPGIITAAASSTSTTTSKTSTSTTTTTTTTLAPTTSTISSSSTQSNTELTLSPEEANTLNEFITSTELPTITKRPVNPKQCGVNHFKAIPKVVGGKNSAFGAWPWQVSVRRTSFFGFTSTHRCGGALLNNQWIATAGHCVSDLLLTQIRIRVGEYDFSSGHEPLPHIETKAKKKIVHPNYNYFTYENDLALVQLEEPIDYQPHVSPICLPPDDVNLLGKNATVTGWGRLSENGVLPSVLQEVRVPIIDNDKCKSMFHSAGRSEYIPEIFMCAGYDEGGRDSCQGDSGGPLQVQGDDGKWFLAGIISWGIGCGEPSLPGVCTRITKFKQWILSYIDSDM